MKKEFEALYREYFPRIYAFLFKLTENRDLSEELTQETFYQAFIAFYRFRGDSDVFTWLASIAKHTYYRWLRKNKRRMDSVDPEALIEAYSESTSEHPADTAERHMLAERVRNTLAELPQKYRDVTILRVYADMSFLQIGDALQISENSARVIFFRAKKMIMEAIQDEYEL
jgi:RNA polymerase sigma-70 factor (ECF subfamily)